MSRSCRMGSSAGSIWRVPADRSDSLRLLLRFGIVGLLNTAFGYVVFAALLMAGIWSGAALAIATTAGVAFNFQTARHLVFRSRGDAIRFVTLYSFIVVINWIGLRALRAVGVDELLGQALLAPPIAIFSFLVQRTFVFSRSTVLA